MRLLGYVVLMLIGAVAASYWPLTPYLPPIETVYQTVRDNAPFLADWLPDADETDDEETGEPTGSTAPSTVPDEEAEQEGASSEADGATDAADHTIWYVFDLTEIEDLLNEMDLETERDVDIDGKPYIVSESYDGYKFLMQIKACEEEDTCLGLDVFSSFEFQPTSAQLSDLNEKFSYMKFYATSDGELVLQKYITADYGIARGNVRINIATFIDIIDQFEETLTQ